ncbi:MAG: hypothetical protein D3X82_03520 [Candidatus Leucobacter sulfamidivorax]|nr:hypothetical protein [Candidatus Leucobacter sulfamidivorax]
MAGDQPGVKSVNGRRPGITDLPESSCTSRTTTPTAAANGSGHCSPGTADSTSPSRKCSTVKTPKGRRARLVPIIEPVAPVLQRFTVHHRRNAPLLRGPRGGVSTTAALRNATGWDELVASLGLPGLRRHDLRHAGATWFVNAGIPIHVVSDILRRA